MDTFIEMLQNRSVNPTAVRILILKEMCNFKRAFSLADLEIALDTVDKSTLSRTITLFHKQRMIHCIDDGSGSAKYAVCEPHCECLPNELHTHFYCLGCKKTFCLESVSVPEVKVPEGVTVSSINYVLKGYCKQCSKTATELH